MDMDHIYSGWLTQNSGIFPRNELARMIGRAYILASPNHHFHEPHPHPGFAS